MSADYESFFKRNDRVFITLHTWVSPDTTVSVEELYQMFSARMMAEVAEPGTAGSGEPRSETQDLWTVIERLTDSLQACVHVMEGDLEGLAIIQPELRQAKRVLEITKELKA